jgi:hypothetical protein
MIDSMDGDKSYRDDYQSHNAVRLESRQERSLLRLDAGGHGQERIEAKELCKDFCKD